MTGFAGSAGSAGTHTPAIGAPGPADYPGHPPNGAPRPVQGSPRRHPLPSARDPPLDPARPRSAHPRALSPRRTPPMKGTDMTDRRRGTDPGPRTKLTITEVCDDLGIARSTFYDWRAKGRAPRCIKLPNGELRIRRAELESWLNSCTDEAA